ncbi:Aquaporin PIP-type [Fusarium mundagurra]|uniref:Aquaporin PIP-type n=1 Tax=Fusarium mundagurra TaxID=1567541 RepID=A0A8H5Z3P0_9HYPO|nr:Aquaporin PIP-type [Fusarium mundagurra]
MSELIHDQPNIESQTIAEMAVTDRRKARDSGDVEARPSSEPSGPHYRSNSQPFAGRLGANQAYVVEGGTSEDDHVLHHAPDATPHMSFRELMDMRPIKNLDLWKAALIEGIGTLLFVYITIWVSISPDTAPAAPTQRFGSFDNAAFLGPLIGGITNLIFITLFITSFGAVSGAHFNPLITFATFCARLCSLPRLILYVAAQVGGGALAGLLVRASWGGRDFKVGGCWLFTDIVPPRDIFVVELVSATLLLFLAFGVGLDPRQAKIIGPALGPFMVGLTVGTMSFASAFARYGYGGAGKKSQNINLLRNELINNWLMEYVSIPWKNYSQGQRRTLDVWTVNLALWFMHVLAGNNFEVEWSYVDLTAETLVASQLVDAGDQPKASGLERSSDDGQHGGVEDDNGSVTSEESEVTGILNSSTTKRKRDSDDDSDFEGIHLSFSKRQFV